MQATPDEPPVARVIECSREARKVDPAVFPGGVLSRSHAGLDVAVLIAFLVMFDLLVGGLGLPAALIERWPQLGIFWFNAILGAAVLAAVALALSLRRQPFTSIGLNRSSVWRLGVAVVIAVPACFMAGMISNLAYLAATGFDVDGFVTQRGEFLDAVPQMPALWVILFALFVGLHEEILFRGFFLSRLSIVCRSKAAAIVLTSAAFGGLHFYQGPAGVFQTAAVGVVLAVVVTYTRTLWPAIIAHAALDTISIVAAPRLLKWVEELNMAPPSGP